MISCSANDVIRTGIMMWSELEHSFNEGLKQRWSWIIEIVYLGFYPIGDGATWKPAMWMGWPHASSSTGKWTKKRTRREATSRRRGAQKATGLINKSI